MSEKSLQKKKFILEKAREVFIAKGFKQVTMKDIVEACEISRGGLYLYFGSTKEIFLEVLQLGEDSSESSTNWEMTDETSATDLLALFLKEQKRVLLHCKKGLTIAIYEFYFEHKLSKKENKLKHEFEIGIKIIENLILRGVNTGEFVCEDPLATARNFIYVIEGLKIVALTTGVSGEMIDQEFIYMLRGLVDDSY